MSAAAAAQPVPDIFEETTAGTLNVNDIYTVPGHVDQIYLVTQILPETDSSIIKLMVRELNQVDKVFSYEQPSSETKTTPVYKIRCPQLAPAPAAAGAGAGAVPRGRSGGSRRKRSTSRNRRKLRKA